MIGKRKEIRQPKKSLSPWSKQPCFCLHLGDQGRLTTPCPDGSVYSDNCLMTYWLTLSLDSHTDSTTSSSFKLWSSLMKPFPRPLRTLQNGTTTFSPTLCTVVSSSSNTSKEKNNFVSCGRKKLNTITRNPNISVNIPEEGKRGEREEHDYKTVITSIGDMTVGKGGLASPLF